MERVRVDGPNGLRFSAIRPKGCFSHGIGSPFGHSFVTSASESICRIPKSGINPNKAVFTIDSKSSQILIVNRNACELLGYSSRELCEMHFGNLLANKNKLHVSALAEGQLNSEDGTVIILSGKVVDLCTKSGKTIAMSLWVRQIDHENRCLAVAEPVERRVAQILVDKSGYVFSGDHEALMLFQLDSVEKFNGMDVSLLIPAIQLPDADTSIIAKNIRKQKATGKTQEGVSFPLCLLISHHESCNTDTTDSGMSSSSSLYVITIWVFTNISGLIVIDENSYIESLNHHFSMLMFGYPQNKLINEHISRLIPNFGNDCDYLGYVRSRNATLSSLDNEESETETDHVDMLEKNDEFVNSAVTNVKLNYSEVSSPIKDPRKVCLDFTNSKINEEDTEVGDDDKSANLGTENGENNKNATNITVTTNNSSNIIYRMGNSQVQRDDNNYITALSDCDLLTPVNETSKYLTIGKNVSSTNNIKEQLYSTDDNNSILLKQESSSSNIIAATPKYIRTSDLGQKSLITSTPDPKRMPANATNISHIKKHYSDGKYRGEAIHSDGNVIDILYTISNQMLPCGRKIYCIWISRDPDSHYNNLDDEERNQNLTLTFNSITSNVDTSLGQAIKITAAAQNSSRPHSCSLMSQCEEDQAYGEYSKHYTTLKQIGKGAYGYVKMSYRNSDRLLVISKFILKEKLVPHFMIKNEESKEIPMEIYLLTHVMHPNIVSVYDVFENEKFFQLVMELHGSGMDLFEFIDREPEMSEELACYIFRQIAHAVEYLHSLNILHRDIKDENIIIDHNFHVKLIDFGSATFMEKGKLFSTFYGTTEYCSPEVLAGNKYAGPELEMWALGVTLYVINLFQNPFYDIEQTLKEEVYINDLVVSPELKALLLWMLDKNPKTRCTMKELLNHSWMNQKIDPTEFIFEEIVSCEPFEVSPEKYYNGQIYSSTAGLSTSPHSLSLVDDDNCDDSFIDPDELLDDESMNFPNDEPTSSNARLSLTGKDIKALSNNMNSLSLIEDGTNTTSSSTSTCINYVTDKGIVNNNNNNSNAKKCDNTDLANDKNDADKSKNSENANYEIINLSEYDDDSFEDESRSSN